MMQSTHPSVIGAEEESEPPAKKDGGKKFARASAPREAVCRILGAQVSWCAHTQIQSNNDDHTGCLDAKSEILNASIV